MKTMITVPANSYNDFCYKISHMMVDIHTVKVAGPRYKIYNITGDEVATYDERKDHGILYNYHTYGDLTGKELRF